MVPDRAYLAVQRQLAERWAALASVPSRPRTSNARRGISKLLAWVGISTPTTRPGRSLIRMKRAAGRPKDRVELEILGALRDEIDDQSSRDS